MNSRNGPILFVATRPYRSDEPFALLSNKLRGRNDLFTIYIDVRNDLHSENISKVKRLDFLNQYFNKVILQTYGTGDNSSRIKSWINIGQQNRAIKKVVKEYKPKVIVVNSLIGSFTKYLHAYSRNNDFELFYLQTVGMTDYKIHPIRNGLKRLVYRFLDISPKFIIHSKKIKCLLWNEKNLKYDNKHLLEIISVGNILFDNSLQQYKCDRVSKIREVVIISQPLFNRNIDHHILEIYKSIISYLKSKSISVRIIAHPRQNIKNLSNKLCIEPTMVLYSEDFEKDSIQDVLFLTVSSVYALDWINRGFPVYSITETGIKNYSQVFGSSFDYYIHNFNQFKKVLEKWIIDPKIHYRKFIMKRPDIIKGYTKHNEPKALEETSSILVKYLG